MLAKVNRLAKKSDIDNLFQRGRRARSPFFAVRFFENNQKNSRFAIVVANKVTKKATVRNRLRRQVREIIRLNLSKFRYNCDVLVNISKECLEKDYWFLEKELLDLLKHNKIINA